MSDVYVAFVRDDQSYAEALAVALQGSGFTVSRSSSVVDAIGECAAIVVMWTPAAARSKLFVDAADRAFRSGKMVLARMGTDPLPQMFAGTEAHGLSRWSGDPESPDIDSIVFHVDRLVSRARLATGARPADTGQQPQAAPPPRGVVHRFPSGGAATARARPAEEPPQPQRMDPQRVDPQRVDPQRMDPALTRPAADPLAEEAAFWRQIQNSNNPGDFYSYLERYGRQGAFAELAESRIHTLSPRSTPAPHQPAAYQPPQYPPPGAAPGAGMGSGGRGGFSMTPPPVARPMPRPAPQQPAARLDPHPARARVEAPLAPPREAAGGGMRGIVFLIFLAVVGGGGFYVYQQFRGPAAETVDTAEDWSSAPEASSSPADDGVASAGVVGDANVPATGASGGEPQRASARPTPASPPREPEVMPQPTFRTIPVASSPPATVVRPPTAVGDPEAAAALLRDIAPPPVATTTPAVATPPPGPPAVIRPPSRPRWAVRPSGRDLSDAYPEAAARRNVEGRVVLDCLIGADLATRCRATSETPGGYGFAAAALRVAQKYRSAPTLEDGRPAAGERATIAINFRPAS